MKVKRNILILLGIFIFVSCYDDDSCRNDDNQKMKEDILELEQVINNFPDSVDLDVSNPETLGFRYPGWDGVLDGRGFNPLDSIYPKGPLKEMKAWVTETQGNNTEKELFIIKEYECNGKNLQKKTFHFGDESGWNYIYDDYKRLIKIEELYNGVLVPERHLTYKYLPFNSDENKVIREVYKNNELIKIETEQIIDNKISLEFDYMDKKTDENKKLIFSKGQLIQYTDIGNFEYIYKFENNESGKIIVINEDSMFLDELIYNSEGIILKGVTYDIRDNPRTIIRTQKAMNHDKYGNWLRKELYENEILVAFIEREITYYEGSE